MFHFTYILFVSVLLGQSFGKEEQPNHCCNPCDEDDNQPIFQLTEQSWRLMLKGEWLVAFCAPTTIRCHKFEDTWLKFALENQKNKALGCNLEVASMKPPFSTTMTERFSLGRLPLILHVRDGAVRELPCSKACTLRELQDLANKWVNIDPWSFWSHPDGWVTSISVQYVSFIDWIHEKQCFNLDYFESKWLARLIVMIVFSICFTTSVEIYMCRLEKRRATAVRYPCLACSYRNRRKW